ncbi:group II intron reverse transcriptase/maturase [Photobacterium sp. DNB23_23_1]|uniref:Group II intron reverse transcriptase/maturase n=1 Tax=Photobacterium pectinilyticum TaxID=2906793 RepID=A0ABT1N9H3_9GAMM|nr:group II intron reverse transcriptase/maturase [Photobacterium sp. ZSDE20]MCQ1061384.1 group II intron reverse transcriptase/maturase [Photobacterium sp. ZSDE20]MDD1830118.1 group II intron reverse transcriptase/maturase [Photobacterium sp. ZSDE20]
MNKAIKQAAEFVEGRPLTKGNSQQRLHVQTQSWNYVTSGLLAVRNVAKKDKKRQFTNLLKHIDEQLLNESFFKLKRRSAAGCDGVTWDRFRLNLAGNIRELHDQIHTGRYKPKPARRVFILKEDGSQRPLSIICLRDKVVQQAMVTVLNQIYEEDFLGFSYGFRPGRGQHDALDALNVAITKRKVNWVLDLDISKFFDTVEHDWLIRFLQHRIGDKRVVRLINQWLKVGILDEHGHRVHAKLGTPQGAVISPLLANIYLHYVFDLWLNRERTRSAQGEVVIVRYADDAVLGFQKHKDAQACLCGLKARLKSFGLQIHPDKTKLIRFGRFALSQFKEQKARGKPGTFDFLGFTHYCGLKYQGDKGEVAIKRKTKRKRLTNQLKKIRHELKRRLHDKPYETGQWLRRVVQGHINYYGVPYNSKSLSLFIEEVRKAWLKALRRRSQRSQMTWSRFERLAKYWIPPPRIVHPYPEKRFYAMHPR